MCPGTCGRIAAFAARAKAAAVVLRGCAGGEKNISEVKADEKRTGKLCQFCSNRGEKGIPKERLVLATNT